MLDKDLEQTLHDAFRKGAGGAARIPDGRGSVVGVAGQSPGPPKRYGACGADLGKLRTLLSQFLGANSPLLAEDDEREPQATLGFQRVLQRGGVACAIHRQTRGHRRPMC